LILMALPLAGRVEANAATAGFIRSDTTTQGNWEGVYGGDGYSIANGALVAPSYGSVTPDNQSNYTWASPTTDPRALETGTGASRIASTWFSYSAFYLDVNLTDGNPHQVALYALDWDNQQRVETVQVVDASTNNVLDTRTISGFSGGIYLLWNINGHVHIVITTNMSDNGVASGVFFGGGSANSVGVTVTPSTVNLSAGQTEQFAASVTNSATQAVTWSISPSSGSGSISSSGLYTAPSQITGNLAVTVTATSAAGPSATATANLTVGANANFVNSDTTTQGNWLGVYGGDGYSIANSSQSLPSYATFAPLNQANITWTSSTTDPRALENIGGSRIASAWFNYPPFSLDVNFIDGNTHEFALYALDWDGTQRAEQIQIVDPSTNNVLDTRNISGFHNGIYLVWNITGHVRVNITLTGGPNAVVNGVFFGGGSNGSNSAPAPAPPVTVSVSPQTISLNAGKTQQFSATVANSSSQSVTWSLSPSSGSGSISSSGLYTAPSTITGTSSVTVTATSAAGPSGSATVTLTAGPSANFVGSDTTTQGTWEGAYGADGYSVANATQAIPSYGTFAPVDQANWTWAASTTDPRALETGSGSTRIAATWDSYPSFYLDVNITDGNTHQVALYALDWDNGNRAETIQIVDPSTNNVLDTRSISGFSGGIYLIWNISGHVHAVVTDTAGTANAAISGVFFGGAGASTNSAPPPTPPAAGQLSINPTSINFGSVNVGSGASQPVSLTNSGSASVTIGNVSVSGAGFNASGGSGIALSPGQSTTVNVTFTPAGTGSFTGNVSIPSSATNSSVSVGLQGTGAQPPAPSQSVVLTWQPSASSGVAGYYVYRSMNGGAYTQLTPSPITATTYTDTSVQAGESYDYAVTSVDANGMQSAYSNVAFATIP
jgi:hypothetical protein